MPTDEISTLRSTDVTFQFLQLTNISLHVLFFPIILQACQLLVYLKGGLFHRVEYVNWVRCFDKPDFAQCRSKSSHFHLLPKIKKKTFNSTSPTTYEVLEVARKKQTPASDVILLCGSVYSAHDMFQ